MNNKIKISIIAVVILALIVVGFKLTGFYSSVDKSIPDKDWMVDNCDCIERNNLKCKEGYELKERICVKDNLVTNVLLGCSKYDCDGTIYGVEE